MNLRNICIILLLCINLAACGESGDSSVSKQTVAVNDAGRITQGAQLYGQNCAKCHGNSAQGKFNWRKRGPDGKFPPPPLDGTGHTWHHPLSALRHVIKNGSPGGAGNMPAWKGKLSDEEIDSIIAWFQSKWPSDVYAEWTKINNRAKF